MNVPNRAAVELNSRGQRPRSAREPRDPERLKFLYCSTLSGSVLFDGSDPVALPPAIKLVRYANQRASSCAKPIRNKEVALNRPQVVAFLSVCICENLWLTVFYFDRLSVKSAICRRVSVGRLIELNDATASWWAFVAAVLASSNP